MEIKRDAYLEQLKIRKDNGMVKIITGIRRCGKSFLLFVLFKKYLLESGVDNNHIIEIALDGIENEELRNPKKCYQYIKDVMKDDSFIISELITNPTTVTSYSLVSFTDYLLKIFSSISPSHERTIDDLMLSQGADTMSILVKLAWIPKYPFVYAKNYYHNIMTPNNGPLSEIKYELKRRIN